MLKNSKQYHLNCKQIYQLYTAKEFNPKSTLRAQKRWWLERMELD